MGGTYQSRRAGAGGDMRCLYLGRGTQNAFYECVAKGGQGKSQKKR